MSEGGGGALLPPVVVRLMGNMTQLKGTLAAARREVDGTAGGFKRAGATAATGLATMGKSVSLIGAGVAVASVKMAGDFQAETMVLHTAAGETLKGLATVRKGILNIASGTGTGIPNLVDGMYQVEKAGYRGADGLKVLKAAAQGAKEENARLDTVTNAMTSVMASYHLGAEDSVRVMNALKTAAGEGKMTMEEFAGSLSTVLPIASANKISLEDVTGALATLTQHGTSAREGTQELAATIRQLAAPNNVAVQEMQRFGLSSLDVSTKLGKRGLTGTLNMLSQTVLSKMGKNGTVLMSAFNNSKQAAADANEMIKQMPKSIQGVARSYSSGSISLGEWRKKLKGLSPEQANLLQQYATLQNKSHGFNDALKRGGPAAKTYTDAIKRMTGGAIGLNTTLQLTGESTEGTKERVKKVGESFHNSSKDVEGWKQTAGLLNTKIAQSKEKLHVLAIEIGSKLIPVVTKVIDFFARHKNIAVALAAVIGGVLLLSVVAFAAKTAISAGKTVVSIGKMGVGAVKAGARVVQGFRSAEVAGSAFSGKAGKLGGALRKGFDGGIRAVKATGRAVKSLGSTLGRVSKSAAKSAWTGTVNGIKAVGRAARTAAKAVGTFAMKLARASKAAAKSAWTGLVNGIKGVGRAAKTAALNMWGYVRSLAASALAGFRAALAWTAQKLALIGSAIAERAAAIAQWALNIAMDANPVMLIVLAIVALIAIVVICYMKFSWFRSGVQTAWKAIVDAAKAAWKWLKQAFDKIVDALSDAYHGVVRVGGSLLNWVKALPGRILHFLSSLASKLAGQASSAWSSFKSAVVRKATDAVNWVRGLPGRIRTALGNLGSKLLSAGRDLITGFIHGVEQKAASAVDIVKNIGHKAVSGIKSVLGIASPSKVFRSIGVYINQGLVDGLTGSTARVKAATRRIESLLMEARNRLMDQRTSGRSRSGRATNRWVASHLRALSRVERYVHREDSVMRSLAAKRDAIAKRLKDAQKHLADLQKAWADEVKSVSQGIMQGFSIVTEAPQEGFALTAQDVVNKMRDQMARAVQFAAQLQALKKKGLSADLIAQIAAAGVDQGGATATALASASKGQIAEINRLQKTTQSAADSAGRAVADSMYGSGIKAAQGLVKGLQSQEKAIEKQMMRIAKAMQRAIRVALGIHSPSRVFAAIGQWIPRGLAAGVEGAAHHATGAVRRLAGSVTGAGAMQVGSGLAIAGGGGGMVVHQHYEIHVEGNVTTVDKLSRDIEAAFLRRGMRNPMTYPAYKR